MQHVIPVLFHGLVFFYVMQDPSDVFLVSTFFKLYRSALHYLNISSLASAQRFYDTPVQKECMPCTFSFVIRYVISQTPL